MNADTQLTRRSALCALRRRLRDTRGQSLVEFVLALPILLVIVFGIIEFATAWRTYQVVTNVAREGARLGVIPGTSTTDVTDRIDSLLVWGNLSLSKRTVTLSCIDEATGTTLGSGVCGPSFGTTGDRFEVELDYLHDWVVLGPVMDLMCSGCGGFANGSVTLTSRSNMRDE